MGGCRSTNTTNLVLGRAARVLTAQVCPGSVFCVYSVCMHVCVCVCVCVCVSV